MIILIKHLINDMIDQFAPITKYVNLFLIDSSIVHFSLVPVYRVNMRC